MDTDFEEFFVEAEFKSKDGKANNIHVSDCLKEKLAIFNTITGENHTVNSGIRSKNHNQRVGGAKKSAHLSGHAVDIKCTEEKDRHKYITAAIKAGFTRIGIHKRFIHLDCKGEDTRIWLY